MENVILSSNDLLIVDKNPIDRDWIDRTVGSGFWEIVHAETCEEAVELCQKRKFSVVIIESEPMDSEIIPSLTAIRRGEGLSNTATIIAMSAFAPGSFDVLLTQSGADAHFLKPIQGEELLGIIERYSKKRSGFQETERSNCGKE